MSRATIAVTESEKSKRMVEEYDKDIEWIVKYNGTTTHKFKPIGRLVRCKDCEHCEKRRTANYNPFFYCLMQECSVKDNDFCSYGERKGARA